MPIILTMIRNAKHPKPALISYIIGMLLGYATLGVSIQYLDLYLQAWLQSFWVLIPMSLILLYLALPILGLKKDIRLPDLISWRPRTINTWRCILLGLTTPMVLSPCTAPPLIASMAFIAESTLIHGIIYSLMLSIGIAAPLLSLGLFGIHPKMSKFMTEISPILGLGTVLFAISLVARLLDPTDLPMYWLITLIGMILLTFKTKLQQHSRGLVLTALALLGAYHWQTEHAYIKATTTFSQSNRPTLLYVTATWCSECQQVKQHVLSDKTFLQAMQDWSLQVVDITHFNREHQQFLKRFNIPGPPLLLLFHANASRPYARFSAPVDLEALVQTLREETS
jgi:thiol:disulfide interchange protein DsbD